MAEAANMRTRADAERPRLKGAGGTPGGIVDFVIGFMMAVGGAYLLTNQVMVVQEFQAWPGFGWFATLFGARPFGLSLLPFMAGLTFLFFNGKSLAGWLLLITGCVIIVLGILMNLQIYFRPTSLFNTLLMLGLLAGGLGLMAKALRPDTLVDTE